MKKQFPKNFLWGAATSSYQVEGGNVHCDWWAWEKKTGKVQSANACEHFIRFEQDFDLARDLNHNAHRMSVEWSRIEPVEGQFDQAVIEHYIKVVSALRVRGIEPIVTLHHFTNPAWVSESGGWTDRRSIQRFGRFCAVIIPALAPYVRYWITINEPTIYFSHSFMFGVWPPQAKSLWKAKAVRDHMVDAHIKVYRFIHDHYQQAQLPKPQVSISQHVSAIVACSPTKRNQWAVKLRDRIFNFDILDALHQANTLDFIGLNYYSRHLVDVTSWWIGNMLAQTCEHNHLPLDKNSLGWDIFPEGLYLVLKKLDQRYSLPVFITENGICTGDDGQRVKFIKDHINSVHRAMKEGVAVQGYLYWSLLDNFEWDKGFTPRFGLIDVNYTTQERTVRASARVYATICKSGEINDE